jgi:hypothetical protein
MTPEEWQETFRAVWEHRHLFDNTFDFGCPIGFLSDKGLQEAKAGLHAEVDQIFNDLGKMRISSLDFWREYESSLSSEVLPEIALYRAWMRTKEMDRSKPPLSHFSHEEWDSTTNKIRRKLNLEGLDRSEQP